MLSKRRALELLCSVTVLALLRSIVLREDQLVLATSSSSKAGMSESPLQSLHAPAAPVTSLQEYLLMAMSVNKSYSPFLNCNATSQVRFEVHVDGQWYLQSLDARGVEKLIGGDEYHVEYVVGNQSLATAFIRDLHNGRYRLEFLAPPLPRASTEAGAMRTGELTIAFGYTCGIGYLAPPLKDKWLYGANSLVSTTVPAPRPYIRPFVRPNLNGEIDFGKYDRIMGFGDSIVDQFIGQGKSFHSNAYFARSVRKPFNAATTEELWGDMVRMYRVPLSKPNGTAVILGSALWDILSDAAMDENSTVDAHIDACREIITRTRDTYPKADLYWKSPFAVHIHYVDIPRNQSMMPAERDKLHRVKYMSSSRVYELYERQRALMAELNVPFIDLYNATLASSAWLYPGDGRHYQPELNEHMMNWYYPNNADNYSDSGAVAPRLR